MYLGDSMQKEGIESFMDEIICNVCLYFPKNTIECTQCGHLFCSECIYAWFNHYNNYCCPFRCGFGTLRPVSGALKRIVESAQKLICSYPYNELNAEYMEIVKESIIDWNNIKQYDTKM